MTDIVIKPSNSDGSVKLQTEGGTNGLTMANTGVLTTSGNVAVTGTVTGGTLGSGVTFPSGIMCGFTETTTTPTASQGTDTSYTTLTGSSVDYTPVAGSSFVVYQYSFVISAKDNNPIILFQSYYDGSVIANTGEGTKNNWGDQNSGMGRQHHTIILPSWSGSKNLHIKYKIYDTNSEARIQYAPWGADSFQRIYRTTYSVM